MGNKWTLEGYNPSEEKIYEIKGEFDSEAEAEDAARKLIVENGSQDWISVVRPDGSKYRYLPP